MRMFVEQISISQKADKFIYNKSLPDYGQSNRKVLFLSSGQDLQPFGFGNGVRNIFPTMKNTTKTEDQDFNLEPLRELIKSHGLQGLQEALKNLRNNYVEVSFLNPDVDARRRDHHEDYRFMMELEQAFALTA